MFSSRGCPCPLSGLAGCWLRLLLLAKRRMVQPFLSCSCPPTFPSAQPQRSRLPCWSSGASLPASPWFATELCVCDSSTAPPGRFRAVLLAFASLFVLSVVSPLSLPCCLLLFAHLLPASLLPPRSLTATHTPSCCATVCNGAPHLLQALLTPGSALGRH